MERSQVSSQCRDARNALSARLDGEETGVDATDLDVHLGGCADCRAWSAACRLPLRSPAPAPDLSARILDAMATADPRPAGPARAPALGTTALGTPALGTTALGTPALGTTAHGVAAARRQPARTAALAAAVAVAAAVVGVVAAHAVRGGGGGSLAQVQQVAGSSQHDSRYPGATVLPVSVPKPPLVLTDTSGQPWDLGARTAGQVTLVYFGYTHCPDVCPVNLALAADALTRMPAAAARQVRVVFVSTDPTRDTPAVVRAWLDNFSPRFVGLTGSIDAVHAAERTIGMSTSHSEAGGPASAGGYQVVHSAFTLVYAQDDRGHLQMDTNVGAAQYATTLEHLVSSGFVG